MIDSRLGGLDIIAFLKDQINNKTNSDPIPDADGDEQFTIIITWDDVKISKEKDWNWNIYVYKVIENFCLGFNKNGDR